MGDVRIYERLVELLHKQGFLEVGVGRNGRFLVKAYYNKLLIRVKAGYAHLFV